MLTRAEVREHASRKSCWVVIDNAAYDVTSLLDSHPGGTDAILRFAGRDASDAFRMNHPGDTLEKHLRPEQKLGKVSGTSESDNALPKPTGDKAAESQKIRLKSIINIQDFELAAAKQLSPRAFAFYRSGADSESTLQWNRSSWRSIRFRPRILRPMSHGVDLSTTILGSKVAAPFFISPAGGGKLAHPTGEVLMTKAAAQHNLLQWVSNAAGCSQGEIADVKTKGQVIYWQIYAMRDLAITEKEIRSAVERGYGGFALTVDAIVTGNRERDRRRDLEEQMSGSETGDDDGDEEIVAGGVSVTRPLLYEHLDWNSAISWLRSLTDLPIAIKGVQTWEDAQMCLQYPDVHPWLSNHGGRQLEGAPSAVDTLLEIRQHCPEVFVQREVIVDGGITRGTDIVKALCLGAKAVGLGRPFLYALMYGEKGVSKAIRILSHEVSTAMALLGAMRVQDLKPEYVDASAVRYAYASRL